jgi:two-component system, cell cycle response regulator
MRVLIAEDDPVHRRLIEHLLEGWGYTVLAAADGAAAWRLLESEPAIPLVIADWEMPEMDGLALCRAIRGRFTEPYVYVILLTARDERDDMLQGFEAGADDYLTKPVHHSELNARIRAAKRILDLQQKLLEAQERLRVQAMYDALTGIFNRGAVFEALRQELDRAKRQQSPLAAIMIDLDHFKQVNDQHGHLVGDQVLRETAQRIRRAVRKYDTVGRYGGEEFLVVAPGFAGAAAMDFAERLRLAFASSPIQTSGPAIPVTLSLGVVAVERGWSVELTDLLSAADDALYRAKSGGRNRAVPGSTRGKET